MTEVVCNTGPLIGLARAGLAWLPFRLFDKVIIPAQVRDELLVKTSPDRQQLEDALEKAHIHTLLTQPDPLLATKLDEGETAVITTALELSITSVLIDERKARKIAARVYGLQVKGSAGLLVAAKQAQLISEVSSPIQNMIQGGYYLGPRLVSACLKAAGEATRE